MVLSIWSQVVHVSPFPQPLGTSWHHPFALFDSSDRKEMWHGGPAARAFSGWRNSIPRRRLDDGSKVPRSLAKRNDLPPGNLTVCYWKLPFIVNLPIKNCDFPWFFIVMLVYQRVSWRSTYFINVHQISSDSHEMAKFSNHFSSKFINPSNNHPTSSLHHHVPRQRLQHPRQPHHAVALGGHRQQRVAQGVAGRQAGHGHAATSGGQRKVWAKVRTETTQKRSKKCCFYIGRNSKDEMCSNVFSLVVHRKCWF